MGGGCGLVQLANPMKLGEPRPCLIRSRHTRLFFPDMGRGGEGWGVSGEGLLQNLISPLANPVRVSPDHVGLLIGQRGCPFTTLGEG